MSKAQDEARVYKLIGHQLRLARSDKVATVTELAKPIKVAIEDYKDNACKEMLYKLIDKSVEYVDGTNTIAVSYIEAEINNLKSEEK